MQTGESHDGFKSHAVTSMRQIATKYPCPMGGYGGRFRHWLVSPNLRPYGSFGNGSAMRVSPCGDVAATLDEALALAKQSAEVTHSHPEGIKGAQAVAAAIVLARTGESRDGIRSYVACGCTALLDAIGGAIHHIGNVHKYAREEDRPEHTLFVITTDGMENASRHYSSDRVKQMIERQKSRYGWEFLFLGANIDAVETAGHFGIDADRAVNYHSDSEGTALNYEVLSETICAVRCSQPLGCDWKKRIDEDYKRRK